MSKLLKIKKVYIDSRYRTDDSRSETDFKFELKQSIDLPDNCVCFIDDIQIPHTWYSVESYNSNLYVQMGTFIFKLPLTPQNHTGLSLATDIQTTLNTFPTYGFLVSYNTSKGTLTVNSSTNKTFRFFTDRELRAMPKSTRIYDKNSADLPFNQDDLQSANSVLRNNETSITSTTYTTQFIDLLNTHSIFIHSPHIGSFETLGVRGESTIIKKVPVTSSYGYLIVDSVVANHDKIDVSRQMFKQLEFSLKNVHGNTIDLHGSSISFSLIF